MEIVWTPSGEVLEQANVVRLLRRVGVDDYRELQRRSAEEPEWFWPAAIEDMGLEFSRPWDRVVDVTRGPEWATWFVGGRLNLAWNCVHRWARGARADAEAAVWQSEDGGRRALTYRELSGAVTRLAEALVALGVEPGEGACVRVRPDRHRRVDPIHLSELDRRDEVDLLVRALGDEDLAQPLELDRGVSVRAAFDGAAVKGEDQRRRDRAALDPEDLCRLELE